MRLSRFIILDVNPPFCSIFDRDRDDVPALVQMNCSCVCGECVAVSVEALIERYHPINPFAPVSAIPRVSA